MSSVSAPLIVNELRTVKTKIHQFQVAANIANVIPFVRNFIIRELRMDGIQLTTFISDSVAANIASVIPFVRVAFSCENLEWTLVKSLSHSRI
jgi:hypothetical protein